MPTDFCQRQIDAYAAFIRRHPWWQRLTRTPFSAKMTKYAVGSVIAFITGNIFFAMCYWLGFSTTVCSVVGFISAAIPNWILNRRWAWQQTGRPPARQVIAYVAVSVIVLITTSLVTGWTNSHIQSIPQHYGLRLIIVTASYVAVTVVLFFAKFAVYEFWIFSDRDRVREALRSRTNVNRIARANRVP